MMSFYSELQVIVLEDRPEYIRGLPPGKAEQMEREPFELRVVCNPSLRATDESGARFYEGCLSVPGYQVTICVIGLAKFQMLFMYRITQQGISDNEAVGVSSHLQLSLKPIGWQAL